MQATMASRDENATPKRRKCSSSSSDASPVDPISKLPDSIISYILSSLPTKDAVATSILSRSWRFRWTTVTGFYFENSIRGDDADQTMDFPEFINTVLLRHSGESIIQFVLRWEAPTFRPAYLNLWTNIAISRNVRLLDLKTETTKHCEFYLPSSLYCCGTLEVLKLEGFFRIKPPNVVCLPKLTDMDLVEVIYESDESLHVLVCGCPVLKCLNILRANERDNLRVCSITSPVLKDLKIDNQDLGPGLPSGGGDHLQLKIDAPALMILYIYDTFSSHISIQQRLPSLVEGVFDAPFLSDNNIVEVLHAFGPMKYMILGEKVLNALENVALPACFKTLTRLAINSDCLPRWSCLMHVLDGCSKLQNLEVRGDKSGGDPWMDPARPPSCLSSSLMCLKIRRFDGLNNEMAMLKFFLNHGLKMKRVCLSCDWSEPTFNHEKRLEIRKKVSKLSVASPTCKFYWLDISGAEVEWEGFCFGNDAMALGAAGK